MLNALEELIEFVLILTLSIALAITVVLREIAFLIWEGISYIIKRTIRLSKGNKGNKTNKNKP